MSRAVKHSVMAFLVTGLGLCATLAQSQGSLRAYVVDQHGDVIVDSWGLCWRDSAWTPSAAIQDPAGCLCDGDMLPRGACGIQPPLVQTPITAIATAIATGAAPPTRFKTLKTPLDFNVLFDLNKADLRSEGKIKLDEIAAAAHKLVIEVVIIVGLTDRLGNADYNQKLSEKRAVSVKTYLISQGIPANRIYAEGLGSQHPATRADACAGPRSAKVIACLQPDRRIEIEVIGTQK